MLFLLVLFKYNAGYAQHNKAEEELLSPLMYYLEKQPYSLEFTLQGLSYSRQELPFWMEHNQRGRISKNTSVLGTLSAKAVSFVSDESSIIYGTNILYQDAGAPGIQLDEIYAHYQDLNFYVTVGKKQQREVLQGLSASNGNMLLSLNTRAIPGVQIGSTSPFYFTKKKVFGLEGSWNEYFLGDSKHSENVLLHYKKFGAVLQLNGWDLKAGVQHMAQWAGTLNHSGEQPSGFNDYLQVVLGSEGTTKNARNQLKSKGNHLGIYEFHLGKSYKFFKLQFFYNHLFEDISGRRFENFPDGRYGFYYEAYNPSQLINAIIYEFYYTQHQSYTASGFHKYDNYFNSNTYRSGWTYKNRVIGTPFFTGDSNENGIINNKFTAHHIGISGELGNYFQKYPYKLLLSYAKNEGVYSKRYSPEENVFYGLFDINLLQKTIHLNFQSGVEFNNTAPPNFGAGIRLMYKL
ncbi:hypothetical protein GCM10007103_28910 [Salinimicrobium marinum]|uniref:Capsule assembly protein Wzi n=2 Tax=Salinimicrobium marinum TaxID=680283 RepID=A0A918SKP7_9FLAO|nr:hypothetical protein GCM10007103_28910 [Salinimicrobium marinum]